MAKREVRTIDYDSRMLVMSDDQTFRISDLFDANGHPTSDPSLAVLCIAGETGAWLSVRLGDYDRAKLQ